MVASDHYSGGPEFGYWYRRTVAVYLSLTLHCLVSVFGVKIRSLSGDHAPTPSYVLTKIPLTFKIAWNILRPEAYHLIWEEGLLRRNTSTTNTFLMLICVNLASGAFSTCVWLRNVSVKLIFIFAKLHRLNFRLHTFPIRKNVWFILTLFLSQLHTNTRLVHGFVVCCDCFTYIQWLLFINVYNILFFSLFIAVVSFFVLWLYIINVVNGFVYFATCVLMYRCSFFLYLCTDDWNVFHNWVLFIYLIKVYCVFMYNITGKTFIRQTIQYAPLKL